MFKSWFFVPIDLIMFYPLFISLLLSDIFVKCISLLNIRLYIYGILNKKKFFFTKHSIWHFMTANYILCIIRKKFNNYLQI